MKNLQFYKTRKRQLKLTNKEISEQSGIPIRTVEDFFRGASENPRIDTVDAINKVLQIKSDADLTPEEIAAGATETKKISLSADEYELVMAYREIGRNRGTDTQQALLAVAEKMI